MNDKLTTMNELSSRQIDLKVSMMLSSRRAALAEKKAKKAQPSLVLVGLLERLRAKTL